MERRSCPNRCVMAAHEAAVRCAKTYDVVIIGGGPAGLNVLSALHNREGALTDKEQSEMYPAGQWTARAGGRGMALEDSALCGRVHCAALGKVSPLELCVAMLALFLGCFRCVWIRLSAFWWCFVCLF